MTKGKNVRVKAKNPQEAKSIARTRYPKYVPVSAYQVMIPSYRDYVVRMKPRKK